MPSGRIAKAAGIAAVLLLGVACGPSRHAAAGAGGTSGAAGGPGGAGGAGTCVPSPSGEQSVSLAGEWMFTPSGAAQTTIEVPGGGWLAQGFHITAARYARTLTVPLLGVPQATLIKLGAVNHEAALSIDGNPIATNTTSFTPSVFDVTAAVTPGAQHALTIDVKGRDALRNTFHRKLVPDAAGWSPNIPQGIFRSAIVRVLPELHVSDAFVRTDVAGDALGVDVSVTNSGAAARTGTVSASLSSWSCAALSYPTLPPATVTVQPGETVVVTLGPVTWGLGASSYWWPNVPYQSGYRASLHYASISVTTTGGATHTLPVRFGFRQIAQAGDHYEPQRRARELSRRQPAGRELRQHHRGPGRQRRL